MKLAITNRARQYGYVIWSARDDVAMRKLLGDRESVSLVFRNGYHGEKRVDWRFRRISVGHKWTRLLSEDSAFYVLKLSGDELVVEVQ